MRITKYEHATLVLEKDGERLVIDPGSFLQTLTAVTDVVAIILTHEHVDHWTPAGLDLVLRDNPGIPIYGPAGVAAAASGYDITVVSPGDEITVGTFTLRFFGGVHAEIHSSIPLIDNVGVLVDGTFYYPGDSYAVPTDVDVAVLAAPVGAPWLKIGDAMDFVLAVAPRAVFGTHDMTLSRPGLEMGRARLEWAVQQDGGTFHALEPGDSIEL
ncbi:MBL fold metallo-hydrolase [Microbacterium gorillae]|uniref:MBL fold metallo-hydrolase n=1 Tax=Microbacterium gorillae TaxID=1231063 RepID=UPI00058E6232|nr:MBL fold metallo-hydrolase [Microbacterium gorillae]